MWGRRLLRRLGRWFEADFLEDCDFLYQKVVDLKEGIDALLVNRRQSTGLEGRLGGLGGYFGGRG